LESIVWPSKYEASTLTHEVSYILLLHHKLEILKHNINSTWYFRPRNPRNIKPGCVSFIGNSLINEKEMNFNAALLNLQLWTSEF
jgi:hypothetical protein